MPRRGGAVVDATLGAAVGARDGDSDAGAERALVSAMGAYPAQPEMHKVVLQLLARVSSRATNEKHVGKDDRSAEEAIEAVAGDVTLTLNEANHARRVGYEGESAARGEATPAWEAWSGLVSRTSVQLVV